MNFPAIKGRNLEGRPVSLPGDLVGAANLLVMSYRDTQQQDANTWIPIVRDLRQEYERLAIYEVYLTSRIFLPGRSVIDGALRRSTPTESARQRTFSVYTNKLRFLRKLGLKDTSVSILLVDAEGCIPWRCTGPFSDARLGQLRETLGRVVPLRQPVADALSA